MLLQLKENIKNLIVYTFYKIREIQNTVYSSYKENKKIFSHKITVIKKLFVFYNIYLKMETNKT